MAKQVWAAVMKGGAVRQNKVRNEGEREVVINGEIQTHDMCKRGQSRPYPVTEILLKTELLHFEF